MFEQEATLLEQGAIMFEQEGFLGNIQKITIKVWGKCLFFTQKPNKICFRLVSKVYKSVKKTQLLR